MEQQSDNEANFAAFIQRVIAEANRRAKLKGPTEAAARAILTVLRVRGIALPEIVRERTQAAKDLERLRRWLEKAMVAPSVAEVIDEPS